MTAESIGAARGDGRGLLRVASALLLLLAAAQGYVSFQAQYAFVDHAKRANVPSILEALGLDAGAVIFALLALSLARRGRRGTAERILNVACALGSLVMNLLAADLNSPRSVTVWVMPSALYALASDRLIAVVRRWAQSRDQLTDDGSAWRAIGGIVLWVLRLVLDARGTVKGFRRWVLAAAPVAPGIQTRRSIFNDGPGMVDLAADDQAPGWTARLDAGGLPDDQLAPGEKKREALIRLYERCGQSGDPRYGNRAKAAALAGEIAGRIGYHPGTARRELVKYLAAQSGAALDSRPELKAKAEAVV